MRVVTRGSCFGMHAIQFLMLLSVLLPLSLCAQASPPGNSQDWTMTFQDEFNGTTLDRQKWATAYPGDRRTTPSNSEQEWYVDDAFDESNGTLKIIAQKQLTNGLPYSSGMIASYNQFSQQYGYFETRAKLPAGKGLWPAFWMLPQNGSWPPEIDIMENLGNDLLTVYFTHHWGTASAHQMEGNHFVGPDFSQDFHTYGLYWDSATLIWYVDNQEVYRTTNNIQQTPMYLIANFAVGGFWGGNPDASTRFPATYEIDYIRAWKKREVNPQTIQVPPPSPPASSAPKAKPVKKKTATVKAAKVK